MTLAISALTSSGIVLTTDSRQTYRNQAGAIRIGSDSAMKLFKLTNSCGVAISGRAFLNEKDQPPKDAGFFINKFAKSHELNGLTVKDIAETLNTSLGDVFVNEALETVKKQIEDRVKQLEGTDLSIAPPDGNLLPYTYKGKDGQTVPDRGWIETIHMIVAGIDSDNVSRAYSVLVPKGITTERNSQQCGALWVGQTDVISRIVKGYAPEIENLDLVKEALSKSSAGAIEQLNRLEYLINWGTITLQDAIDFCVLMTRTTASIQRFSDGTSLMPGGIPGVGGEIDIAVITPEKGFAWLRQKTLKSEGSELSLDSLPAVEHDQTAGS